MQKKENKKRPVYIRFKKLMEITTMGKTTIHSHMKNDKKFPKVHKLSERIRLWNEDAVYKYIENSALEEDDNTKH
jgi:predicted DNA-binding transcriptional regulator AlpA